MSKFKVGERVVMRNDSINIRDWSHLVGKEFIVRIVDLDGDIYLQDFNTVFNRTRFDSYASPAVVARNKYFREIKPGVWVDVYDVLRAFNVTDACLQHLIKKALAAGQRGHKDTLTDYKDILESSQRALEMFEEFNTTKGE